MRSYRQRLANYYDSEPRMITAKFDSTCAETGQPIRRGDECLYFPRKREVYRVDSKTAEQFRSVKFDEVMLGFNY